ncbi:DUF3095 domain-containing protein [Oceanobacter mangrovi]|uniref:DUF3095 domain-containing protein n=1 Tax=Oceanobacter mangrovi TaxID=2862510 RepID=UPI001C8D2CA5|nr:DUF3095 domain-containing protein [Oceanobacter mangrovi]
MPFSSTELFYAQLQPFRRFARFTELEHYQQLPDDWWVAVSDIQGSTGIIEEGRYQDVNAVSAATIASVLNACHSIEIPYVFGGDGMAACVPDSCQQATAHALMASARMADEQFGLLLRIGMVPISELKRCQQDLLVARFQPTEHFQQAMFSGSGLAYAESQIKRPGPPSPWLLDFRSAAPQQLDDVSFRGFECRWHKVKRPERETVALLVQAIGISNAATAQIYADLQQQLQRIYGDSQQHHPLSRDNLQLVASPWALATEARIHTGQQGRWRRWNYQLRAWLRTLAGKYLINRGQQRHTDWGQYPDRLINNSDYRKCDEVFRIVLSGDRQQRQQLTGWLEPQHKAGRLCYGLHCSDGALVTCLVSDYQHNHVHFLDGANGGYSLAARQLKQQLAGLQFNSD